MNLLTHSISSKGSAAFVRRIGTIAARFSMSSSKGERQLLTYLSVLRKHGCNATFPVTAVVLNRHPDIIRFLADEGVEFAVHGYVHTDHARLTESAQIQHIDRALRLFDDAGIPVDGFRGPYLRYNSATIAAAQKAGLRYVSNETIAFDVFDQSAISSSRWAEYLRALRLYSAIPELQALARPRFRGDLVELPVAMPDDEILVDRLGLVDARCIGAVWSRLVDLTHARHELLTLQLHPERGTLCHKAVPLVITAAREKEPPVWIAQLRDIASWWRLRAQFRIKVTASGVGSWLVTGPADRRATVLLRNIVCDSSQTWSKHDRVLPGNWGIVRCPLMPVIGVSARSDQLVRLFEEEGYATAVDGDPARCAMFFDRPEQLSFGEEAAVIRSIEASPTPLVRLSRWPNAAASAMAITGDIDALTLRDFVSRVWEVR